MIVSNSFTLFTQRSSDDIKYTATEKIIEDILETFLN